MLTIHRWFPTAIGILQESEKNHFLPLPFQAASQFKIRSCPSTPRVAVLNEGNCSINVWSCPAGEVEDGDFEHVVEIGIGSFPSRQGLHFFLCNDFIGYTSGAEFFILRLDLVTSTNAKDTQSLTPRLEEESGVRGIDTVNCVFHNFGGINSRPLQEMFIRSTDLLSTNGGQPIGIPSDPDFDTVVDCKEMPESDLGRGEILNRSIRTSGYDSYFLAPTGLGRTLQHGTGVGRDFPSLDINNF